MERIKVSFLEAYKAKKEIEVMKLNCPEDVGIAHRIFSTADAQASIPTTIGGACALPLHANASMVRYFCIIVKRLQ
jgi:hypothetical protein